MTIFFFIFYCSLIKSIFIVPDSPSSVQAPEVTSGLLKLRKSLPYLREGEEVMARWSDEGWYFRGRSTSQGETPTSAVMYIS